MKRRNFLGLVVTALLAAACGGQAQPAPAQPAQPAATEAPKATEAPAAEAKPTEAPKSGLPDLAGREVVIAVENAYIPFNFVPKDGGDAQGWDYDTINEMAKRLNFKPVFKQIAWDNMIAAVAAGQFDMAADGITITDERAKVVSFSEGYISVDQRILVKQDSEFKSIDDVKAKKGVKLGSQKGTTNFDEAVKLVGEANVVGFDTFDLAVQAAIAGDVDGTVIDDTAGVGYVGANSDKIKLLDGSLVGQQLGFVFPKDSDLVAPFNAALKALRDDGTLAKINATWFGADFAKRGISYDTIQPGATAVPTVEATAAPATDTAKLPDLGGREVVIAVENAYIPFNFIPKDSDKAEGWDYDTINELAKRLNFKPVYTQIAWDNMIAAVAAGQFDMAADGISITDERAKVVDYSMSYISVDQRMLVSKDSDFRTVDDLKTKADIKIGAQKGTTNYDESVKLVGEAHVTGFDTYDLAVQAAIAKDVDAVNIDDVAGTGYVGANADKVRMLDGKITGGGLGFIYPKGSELVKAIDAGLKSMIDDGSLAKINGKWFGASFSEMNITYDNIKPGATAAPTVTPTK